MLKTTNYKMNKPELTDSPPDITVLNGNFDIIDEKLFAVIKAWEEFKNNGGSIGGPIITNRVERVIPANTIEHGYGFGIGLKSANGLDKMELVLGNNGGKRGLYSVQRFGLGTPDFAFSEIWAGDFSKQANGYTILPNGFILQWGTIWTSSGLSQGAIAKGSVTLPIRFPNKGLSLVLSAELARDPVGGNLYDAKFYPTGSYFTSSGTFDYKIQGIDYISGAAVFHFLALGH